MLRRLGVGGVDDELGDGGGHATNVLVPISLPISIDSTQFPLFCLFPMRGAFIRYGNSITIDRQIV